MTNAKKLPTIIIVMKKLTALFLSGASYLSLAVPAFAATNAIDVNPCTTGGGGGFNVLCNIAEGGIGTLIQSVITILFIVAVVLALGFLIYGGIKWVVSGGDKAKVEAARGTIVAALVGLVLVFLAYFVLNLVGNFFGLDLFNGILTIPTLSPSASGGTGGGPGGT